MSNFAKEIDIERAKLLLATYYERVKGDPQFNQEAFLDVVADGLAMTRMMSISDSEARALEREAKNQPIIDDTIWP